MSVSIIFYSGMQGAGKSALQKETVRVAKEYGFDEAHVLNFADKLYKIQYGVLDEMEAEGYYLPNKARKHGPLLQFIGTDFGRETYGDDVWVDILKKKIAKIEKENVSNKKILIVIGDCRFENEFDSIPSAYRVRLLCPRKERKARCDQWRKKEKHPSEIGLSYYSYFGKFDKYFNTSAKNGTSIEDCVKTVMLEISAGFWELDRNWIEPSLWAKFVYKIKSIVYGAALGG